MALVGEADNAGGSACAGAGVCGASPYLPLSFTVNLKLLLKIKVFDRNESSLFTC